MAAVLDAFASKLVYTLMGMAKEEVEMLLGVPGEITKLETTLGDLSSILADAERKRIRDSAVERWVKELKDVMYDADDILDLCQIMEDRQGTSATRAAPETTSGCWYLPTMLSCFRNPIVAHKIGRKIKMLNQRLLDIEKRSSHFRFITQAMYSSDYSTNKLGAISLSDSNRKTGSGIIRSDIVGEKIEEDTNKIIDLLVKEVDAPAGLTKDNVVVSVAVVGAGGVGKTTLARMVFNDNMVEEHFDKSIWLSVNKEFDQIGILQNAIAALGGNYAGCMADKALLERALKGEVRQKKLLLVLDDVWSESENVWTEILRVPLNDSASGSRVLVTTRNDGVACKMKAQHIHRVDKLQQDDSWILLKKQVVSKESDEAEVDELEDIGRRILKRCDGLPLAIKVVGGLLLTKNRTRDAWIDVCNHYSWSAGIDDDINKAVYLSYEELPSHLKQCFVHCSLFPKDKPIRRGVIVRLWIAEGYIHNKMSSKLPEDLGFEYYKELVSRNLLEPNKGSYSQSACTMHDVVRSFAHYITKDEGLLISEWQDVNRTLTTTKLRHLSISDKAVEWNALQNQDSLKTLMLFGSTTVDLKLLWNNLSCLRVLYLDNLNLHELPDSMGHLKHLRYLCLCGTRVSNIPQSIGDIKFLEAIKLCRCTNISQLPNSILKLRKLRSLNFEDTAIVSLPHGFRKLEDLVEMVGFPTHSDDSKYGWCSLEELGPLSNLKILEIRGLEKAHSGSIAARAKLNYKSHLKELWLVFSSRIKENGEVEGNISKKEHEAMEEVLANLCPPTCIEVLNIEGYFGCGQPKWMGNMSPFRSLRRLVLEDYACCEHLPKGLGQLPFLDYFWVQCAPSVQHVGHDLLLAYLDGDNNGKDDILAGVAFPKLIKLGLEGMLEWTKWDWEEHIPAMLALEVIMITNCKLRHLPPGLAHYASRLRKMSLKNILHLVSVENFPSLVELWLYDNPRIVMISNNPSLQWIRITRCPGLQLLLALPSLQSIEWRDLHAETLPLYLQKAKLNKLLVDCSLSLLKLVALQDDSEWGKIQHVHHLKATGWKSAGDKVNRYVYYTKQPYSFEVDLGDSSDEEVEGVAISAGIEERSTTGRMQVYRRGK